MLPGVCRIEPKVSRPGYSHHAELASAIGRLADVALTGRRPFLPAAADVPLILWPGGIASARFTPATFADRVCGREVVAHVPGSGDNVTQVRR